jgi:hypothetical protein
MAWVRHKKKLRFARDVLVPTLTGGIGSGIIEAISPSKDLGIVFCSKCGKAVRNYWTRSDSGMAYCDKCKKKIDGQ